MKQLLQFVAVVAVTAFVPLAVTVPMSAQEVPDCEISNTGPGSNNECEVETDYECTVNNDNTVTIKNTTTQDSTTGAVSNSNNQGGGSATSGTVTNESGVTFNVTIDNENDTCVAAVVTPPAPEPETPETPKTPETSAPPTQTAAPKTLPLTSGDVPVALLSVGGLAAVAGLTALYRRFHL